MRLEARVSLWLLILLGVSSAAALGGMAWFETHSQAARARETGETLALSVKNSLEVSMLNNAAEDLRFAVTNIKRDSSVESVTVHRLDGSVWISSNGDTSGHTDGAALSSAVTENRVASSSRDGMLSVVVPVANRPACTGCHLTGEPVLGAVGITIDQRPFQEQLLASTRNSLLITAAPLLLGLILSIWAVRRSVLRPLSVVGDTAARLAAGDLHARVPALKGGEFRAVAQTFNDMASRLQDRATDLADTVRQLRSDLEGMEAIQELVAAGAGLREVLTRTARHVGETLAASGVAIWLAGRPESEATWGRPLGTLPWEEAPGQVNSSAGILTTVAPEEKLAWVIAPAIRDGTTLAYVGATWDPPQTLERAERELISSIASLVAVATANADLLERLHQKEASLETVLKKTLSAQEEERRRIARELHDETSQVLHALMMNIDLLETQTGTLEELRPRLEGAKALAEQAGRNLDKVLLDLRPALLDELGLVAALRWYVAQMRGAWGREIDFEAEGTRRLPEHVEVAAFRIAQEALANAVRHADASQIHVAVRATADILRIEVRDDGCGFSVTEASARGRAGDATGILGMNERAGLLDGRLLLLSEPGRGTTVTAEIPLVPALEQAGDRP